MFISPKIAITERWITHPSCSTLQDWEERNFISPNAIDFTVDNVFSIATHNIFVISEAGKQMRGISPYLPIADRADNLKFWYFHHDTMWDCVSDMYVRVPDGVAAMLIQRSTFSRNGLFLASGLYDSGFEGSIGTTLHNRAGLAKVAVGTRIGQIIFIKSQNAKMYEGGYNHAEGTNVPRT